MFLSNTGIGRLLLITMIMVLMSLFAMAQSEQTNDFNLSKILVYCGKANLVDQDYLAYTTVNPFSIRFDSDGDGIPELAMLMKERSSGKVALIIMREKDCKIWILGGDKGTLYKGDDFSYCIQMDVWNFSSKRQLNRKFEGTPRDMKGEGIELESNGTDDARLYWNGKEWKFHVVEGP